MVFLRCDSIWIRFIIAETKWKINIWLQWQDKISHLQAIFIFPVCLFHLCIAIILPNGVGENHTHSIFNHFPVSSRHWFPIVHILYSWFSCHSPAIHPLWVSSDFQTLLLLYVIRSQSSYYFHSMQNKNNIFIIPCSCLSCPVTGSTN